VTWSVPPGAEPYSAALVARLDAALTGRGPAYVPRTRHFSGAESGAGAVAAQTAGRGPRFTNRLILETSPYLLQHAHNPVSWFAWGEEAFEEARRLNRPVFLSIGYSTCHWCHVMEEESFEDLEIATFLNTHYVAVKVDREERPDVDAVYMSAVQRLTGSGGWPMSVWLTADRRPFFGGTYFPPRDGARGARHGFLTMLGELDRTFHREPERVAQAAAALVEIVREDMEGARGAAAAAPAGQGGGEEERAQEDGRAGRRDARRNIPGAEGTADEVQPDLRTIEATVDFFRRSFDAVHGGVRRAPKFPSNVPVRLLLRYHARTGDADALHMALLSLEKMAGGGMYDQLAGGFHRYSTDAEWLVPHFEKMLYDNALLTVAYAEAHQLTGRADLARVARETCDYVLREMTDVAGGFFSATDADSEGEEGRFFVWTEEEIRQVLGAGDLTEAFLKYYDVNRDGNWEGSTILNVRQPDEAMWQRLGEARAKLYQVRARRVPPLRDEKILTAWNGLMISGLAVAGRVLDEPRYVTAAARAAAFVLDHLRGAEGELLRSYKDGRAQHRGDLDDHAFLAAGLLDLYEATFDPHWFERAVALADETERGFADPRGGWFMTSDRHEPLIARERPAYDGAEPSGTSVALMNAARLAAYTDGERWREVAARALAAHARTLVERPVAMTEALLAVDFLRGDPREVVVVWPEEALSAAAPLRDVLRRTFVPARVLAAGGEGAIAALGYLLPFARDKIAIRGQPTAYVCRQGRCELPVHDAAVFAVQLHGSPRPGGRVGPDKP
jgi:uncharacterized protein YyaL (SSP411 family)